MLYTFPNHNLSPIDHANLLPEQKFEKLFNCFSALIHVLHFAKLPRNKVQPFPMENFPIQNNKVQNKETPSINKRTLYLHFSNVKATWMSYSQFTTKPCHSSRLDGGGCIPIERVRYQLLVLHFELNQNYQIGDDGTERLLKVIGLIS